MSVNMAKVHFLLTFMLALNYFQSTESSLSVVELSEMMTAFRAACQSRFPATDDAIDGINLGNFPDDTDLKCYVNCMLESMRMVRRGKFMTDLALKNINMFLAPGELRDEWLKGVESCRDLVIDSTDTCVRSYEIIKCFARNNDHFMIP